MSKLLFLALILVLGATTTLAQEDWAGTIGIFADNVGTNCNLSGAVGLLNVYFLHVNGKGVTASQWAAPHPSCLQAEHISDVCPFPVHIGDTETSIIVGYGTCAIGTFLIMSATYNVLSPATDCCRWSVGPDPTIPSGHVEVAGCMADSGPALGGQAIVNANPSCNCSVPVQDTTWGHVKALYAE